MKRQDQCEADRVVFVLTRVVSSPPAVRPSPQALLHAGRPQPELGWSHSEQEGQARREKPKTSFN